MNDIKHQLMIYQNHIVLMKAYAQQKNRKKTPIHSNM